MFADPHAEMGAVAAVFAALYAAHHVGDYWVQTDHQACTKAAPGWSGRWACAKHVATYTLTGCLALLFLAAATGWRPDPDMAGTGLAVSAVTHYLADRRQILAWLAQQSGAVRFYLLGAPRPDRDDKPCLGTGAHALDQSWHIGWLFIAALFIAG
ncbi:hypothetical protein GCM10010124_26580 [Pilimelia terevasa]|uniref:DUF3307 domain-containing protein n=1 Tax=Pilimelia terevasa TaxID=53372 RepID=A0A8J3FI86_9ACTN|nr:DUF3307 domain-containing protein [Pilimelia terevasa]GGK32478.1 hypothetical protein GCM10010124_26580 [Pilimelia terevasa]